VGSILIPGHHQEGFQLAGEEVGAARVVKCQGRQGVENAGLAHHPTPAGFHPDDADDDLGWHPVICCARLSSLSYSRQKLTPFCVVRGDELGAVAIQAPVGPVGGLVVGAGRPSA
jgi:hypothetical protein